MDDAMDDLDAKNRKKIVVAMCGASGAVYGIRLIRALMAVPVEVYLVISAAGRAILAHEAGFAHKSMVDFLKDHSMACHAGATLVELDPDDGFEIGRAHV